MPVFGKRRALGQHFLRDRQIAQNIAATAVEGAVKHGCVAMLEIGPGRGAITEPLLEEIAAQAPEMPLTLAERDRDLVDIWQAKAMGRKNLNVIPGDFLDAPIEEWLNRSPLGVASNLPYSAGTAIVVRLARHYEKIPFMVLMFQAEVAHRLRAEPGEKSWGSLSIWMQNRWDVQKLCAVPPGAFNPPPDVNSEVVTLTRRATPRVAIPGDERSEALWDSLLKTSFAHRRKMLRSSLPAGSPYRNALDRAGLDGTKRAEALSWEEWERFYRALLELSPSK